jgi:hypothetical protein
MSIPVASHANPLTAFVPACGNIDNRTVGMDCYGAGLVPSRQCMASPENKLAGCTPRKPRCHRSLGWRRTQNGWWDRMPPHWAALQPQRNSRKNARLQQWPGCESAAGDVSKNGNRILVEVRDISGFELTPGHSDVGHRVVGTFRPRGDHVIKTWLSAALRNFRPRSRCLQHHPPQRATLPIDSHAGAGQFPAGARRPAA